MTGVQRTALSTGGRRPLRRDAQANRERILLAAREAFASRGLDVGVEEIAQRAGVGMGTLYRRFPTKDALVDAIFEERLDELGRAADRALADEDPWRGLSGLLERTVALQAEDRGFADVLAARMRDERLTAPVRARIAPQLERLVERAREDGSLRPDATYEDVAVLLWSSGRVADATHDVAPAYWRRHLGLILDALRAPRAMPLQAPPLSRAQHRRSMERLAGERRPPAREA